MDAATSYTKELPETLDQGEDSEDWLTIDANKFEKMLEVTFDKGKSNNQSTMDAMDIDNMESAEDHIVSEQAKQFKDLANKVESFIEGEGDIEGARFEECVQSSSRIILSGLTCLVVKTFLTNRSVKKKLPKQNRMKCDTFWMKDGPLNSRSPWINWFLG